MGTTETGKLISTIRKQKGMTQKDIATLLNVSDKAVSKWERGECYPEVTLLPQLSSILEISIDELLIGNKTNNENKSNKQCSMENYNHNYMKGTLMSFVVLVVALYSSLINMYMIQAVSTVLIFISFCIFYLYDKKYSNLLNDNKQLELPLNFSTVQASCRQFIISIGITAFIFVNFININLIFIKEKYILLENQPQYAFIGVILYALINLVLFLKINKNNSKTPIYFHIGALLTILSSLIIICYQVYIKIDVESTVSNNRILQQKATKLFILLMGICIIYSLLIFTLNNISNKYRVILFVLNIVQHSLLLSVARHSMWFSTNLITNIHGGIYVWWNLCGIYRNCLNDKYDFILY